jgi:hypothetical protein
LNINGKLTSHEEVKPVPNKTLVACKVDPALFNCSPLLLFLLGEFRTKGDTTAEDDTSILLLSFSLRLVTVWLWKLRGITVFFSPNITFLIGSRTHLADVSGKRTTFDALLGSEIELVVECQVWIVLIKGFGDGGSWVVD